MPNTAILTTKIQFLFFCPLLKSVKGQGSASIGQKCTSTASAKRLIRALPVCRLKGFFRYKLPRVNRKKQLPLCPILRHHRYRGMKHPFFKYQGTGNDFVMIDNRQKHLPEITAAHVQKLCDRRFGIGGDGLILIENHPTLDFHMIYYNADGSQSFCGNGSRCAVAFAKALGIIEDQADFLSTDGEHQATIDANNWVKLAMHDVAEVEVGDDYYFLNTGSPHYIQYVDAVKSIDPVELGRAIRYNERFEAEGTNVNFLEPTEKGLKVRTYERGVEDETLSCGTGVTAAALSASVKGLLKENRCEIEVQGGQLAVSFEKQAQKFTNIWLEGPATFVFKGEVDV